MITLTRNTRYTVIYCLCVATLACALGATAGAEENPPSKTVRYADLDLSKPAGAQTLYARIRAAAREVCAYSLGSDPVMKPGQHACIDTAIDNAVRKVNAPELTTLRFGSGDIRLASK